MNWRRNALGICKTDFGFVLRLFCIFANGTTKSTAFRILHTARIWMRVCKCALLQYYGAVFSLYLSLSLNLLHTVQWQRVNYIPLFFSSPPSIRRLSIFRTELVILKFYWFANGKHCILRRNEYRTTAFVWIVLEQCSERVWPFSPDWFDTYCVAQANMYFGASFRLRPLLKIQNE